MTIERRYAVARSASRIRSSERESLMFRVRVRIPPEFVLARVDQVKTGVRGVAWVRLAAPDGTLAAWPAGLTPPLLGLPAKATP